VTASQHREFYIYLQNLNLILCRSLPVISSNWISLRLDFSAKLHQNSAGNLNTASCMLIDFLPKLKLSLVSYDTHFDGKWAFISH